MNTLKMTKGSIYTVKVLKIEHCKKTIHTGPNPQYKHCITIQDGNGNTSTCEYLSADEHVPADIFEVGDFYRQVRCINVHQFGDTIEPFDSEVIKQSVIAPPDSAKVQYSDVPNNQVFQTPTLNLSGKSITFATAYAKDLLVAEMRHWPEGKEVTLFDLDRLARWSEHIAKAMAKGINL